MQKKKIIVNVKNNFLTLATRPPSPAATSSVRSRKCAAKKGDPEDSSQRNVDQPEVPIITNEPLTETKKMKSIEDV